MIFVIFWIVGGSRLPISRITASIKEFISSIVVSVLFPSLERLILKNTQETVETTEFFDFEADSLSNAFMLYNIFSNLKTPSLYFFMSSMIITIKSWSFSISPEYLKPNTLKAKTILSYIRNFYKKIRRNRACLFVKMVHVWFFFFFYTQNFVFRKFSD